MQRIVKIRRGLLTLMMAVLLLAVCMTAAAADDQLRVYFHLNYPGAPEMDAQTVQTGKTLAKPADPVRPDYEFSGWYTNIVCNEPYDFSAPVTQPMRLFAGWTPTRVQATFYLMDGTDASIQVTADVGDTLELPEAPERPGYVFEGWAVNPAGSKLYDAAQIVPAHDLTLYAHYTQQKAHIAFVLYDGQEQEIRNELGQPVAVPEDPVREGYAFTGWFDSAVGGSAYDFTQAVDGDRRIYAHWEKTIATVTFGANYEGGENQTAQVEIGKAVDAPANPVREGYDFTAWYADAAATVPYDFTAPVADDLTLYAGWTLQSHTVTLNENHADGAVTEITVLHGSAVELPGDPSRNGFDFTGWFTDEAAKTLFKADDPILADVTLYAGWQSKEEADGERVIRFLLNDGTEAVHDTATYKNTRRIKEPDAPARPGYYFAGWCKDAEGTQPFDFKAERSTTSMDLHAKWLKGYTFEAEYTNLEGKPGQGSSDNCMGKDLIQTLKDVLGNGHLMGMSNDHYVGKLYYNGAFLEFRINAAEEVTDAVISARLSPDLFDMYFTDETWQVIVNGERMAYGKLNLTGAIAQTDFDELGNTINGDMNKRPFENYVIAEGVHLTAGENVIRLVTNNKMDHGGTFNAETPLIDCLYLFANTELSWAECHPENIGKTMADVTYTVTYETAAE